MSVATAARAHAHAHARPHAQAVPLLLIALGGAFTGFSGILVRVSEIGPIATGGWRLAIAALVFLVMSLGTRGERPALHRLPILALAGLFFSVDIAFYHMALTLTPVAHATLIVNLAPVVALAAGYWLFAERLGVAKLTGLALALGGAILMTGMRANASGTLAGNALAVVGMFGYAFYLITVKHARREHDTLTIMLWSSASAAVCLFAAAAIMGERLIPGTAHGWTVVIIMGLVTHVAGQGLIAYGMREAPVGLGSVLLLTQPLVATVAAWPLFGETLSVLEIAGATLILVGLAQASRARVTA